MLVLLTSHLFLSLLIGYFGRHRRMGFWGLFFGSLVLSPLVGLIILLVTDDVRPEQKQ
jgi:uncharacterized membrane protein